MQNEFQNNLKMKFCIIIPAHNEEDSIGLTLNSLVKQSLLPQEIIVVNDNSTDNTKAIVEGFQQQFNFIKLVNNTSSNQHLPGTKIINAFYKGYDIANKDYDVICKFDADLIFPLNYLEQLAFHFNKDKTVFILFFVFSQSFSLTFLKRISE